MRINAKGRVFMFVLYALLILVAVYLCKQKNLKDEVRVAGVVVICVVIALNLLWELIG